MSRTKLATSSMCSFEADDEFVQRARHLGGVCEPTIAIALQRAHHDVAQRGRHVRACRRRARDLHLHDLLHRAEIAVAREQVLQRQHLVHHDAEREQIDATVDRLSLQLLGREIRRLALHRPRLGDLDRVLERRHAEVEQLHAPRRGDDDVGRRDVAVDGIQRPAVAVAQAVDVVQRAAHLARHVSDDRRRRLAVRRAQRAQDARQRRPLDVFERQEQHAVVFAEVVDVDDVGVVQQPQQLGFVDEHANELGVVTVRRENPLDDDVAREPARTQRPRLEHLGHPPDTQRVQQLVAPHPDHAITVDVVVAFGVEVPLSSAVCRSDHRA